MSPKAGSIDLRVREPAGVPLGALILNHGRGADENDLWPLLEVLDPDARLLGISTGAPFTGIPPGGRHWYIVERVGFPHAETFQHSYEALGTRLDAVLAKHGLGWSRTVIGGFSQGTVMSYAVALGEGRPTPAGLLAQSGFIPEVDGWVPQLENREQLRALIHHGSADPVITADFGRRAAQQLRAAGVSVDHLESPVGHGIPQAAIAPAKGLIATALGLEAETAGSA